MSMFAVDVADASQVAEARRRAQSAAAESGFGEVRSGKVALAATELSTNLIKHAKGGQLLVNADDRRMELLALDRGEGMRDVDACLVDGYSTSGTLGTGLGAVRRLAQTFEVASWPGQGTAVFAEINANDAAQPALRTGPAGVVIAKPGESASGDGWTSRSDPGGVTLLVVDGLGHGTEAAVAANAAVSEFQNSSTEPPADILAAVHRAMRHTRGGAVAVARIEWESETVTFAGLGNIAGAIISMTGETRRLVSHNGIAGHNARRVQSFDYPCPDGVLIMHSDGVGTRWSMDDYPGLVNKHPMLIAGVLYRDYTRGRDDAAIVVARTRPK
jgi:anti-sigma regulatory factor (Ser/Thr protein kinase)